MHNGVPSSGAQETWWKRRVGMHHERPIVVDRYWVLNGKEVLFI